jgi:hypothetical protein
VNFNVKEFWQKWLEADSVERINILKPIAEKLMEAAKVDIHIDSFTSMLNSYFEDLAETLQQLCCNEYSTCSAYIPHSPTKQGEKLEFRRLPKANG